MVQEDGTTCQGNIVPSGKEVTLRFKAEGTTVLESLTLQRHNNTENPSGIDYVLSWIYDRICCFNAGNQYDRTCCEFWKRE